VEDHATEFSLRVTDDRLSVLLTCAVDLEHPEPLAKRILEEMRALGLPDVPRQQQLAGWLLETARGDPRLEDVPLVEGEPPVPPVHGKVEWAGNFFDTGFVIDEKTGAIDYRTRAAQNSVEEGQLLAKLIPPKEGRDGRDVFGNLIDVGKAKRVRIQLGRNVKVGDDGAYYASREGRIRWDAKGLSVDEILIIKGSIGLKSGHITHPGAVIVEKDIEAECRVQADGDIEVKGTIEEADVDAGGNLSVRNGIMGGGAHIKVNGNVHAKFIVEANIEAGEDIVVEREIRHSVLKTRGAVIIRHGQIIGGETAALGGIDVGQSGGVSCVPTVLRAGEDFRLAEESAEKGARLPELEAELKRIHAAVDPLTARQRTLSPKRREALSKLLDNVGELEDAIRAIHAEIDELKKASEARAKHRIIVRSKMYPETIFRIKDSQLRVKETLLGPARASFFKDKVELSPGIA